MESQVDNVVTELAAERPLDAVLAAAWGVQTGGGSRKVLNREKPPPTDDSWMKKWWRKERLMQAVLQLAARRSQRLLWWGSGDVIALSAPNITVFLHICHKVWDLFLNEEQLKPESERQNLLQSGPIREELQAAGIQSASKEWHDKLGEQPGGDVRRRFIDQLGRQLREQLRDDLAMSYPGADGFSLLRDDLEANHALWRFLSEAVAMATWLQRNTRRKINVEKPGLSTISTPRFRHSSKSPHRTQRSHCTGA